MSYWINKAMRRWLARERAAAEPFAELAKTAEDAAKPLETFATSFAYASSDDDFETIETSSTRYGVKVPDASYKLKRKTAAPEPEPKPVTPARPWPYRALDLDDGDKK